MRNYFKRGISYLRRNGISRTFDKAYERLCRDYEEGGYTLKRPDEDTLNAQRKYRFANPYRFSILVPVYETDPRIFREMLDSVGEQTYGNWELIIADASRDESRRNIVREFSEDYNLKCKDEFGSIFDKVVYVRVNDNKGISANTNEALSHAKGDYVGLLDHDDVLEADALFDIMSAIEEKEKDGIADESIRRVMAVYTDEDKVSGDGNRYFDVHRKPSYDPVLLCTNNYICHFFVVDTDTAKSVGGFRSEYDGAQDHDFILRCLEGIDNDAILHVPSVLYHWRSTKGSTSENPESKLYAYEAGKRAVSDHLKRIGINAKVSDSPHLGFYEIEYERLHERVMSTEAEGFAERFDKREDFGGADFVMILSSTLKPLDNDYIADMMSAMHRPDTGAVTGKIIDSKNRIESAGYDLVEGELKADFAGLNARFSGYMHRASLERTVDGFSPDCVLLRLDAVESFGPDIRLKDGFGIYYMPKAAFKRKKA